MKCDICRDRQAVIFVQQVSRGNSLELHLCELCAKERGYPVNENKIDISLGGLFSGLLKNPESRTKEPSCPVCLSTFQEIAATKKTGCSDCYRQFRPELISLLRNEGIEASYTGPLPGKLESFNSGSPDPESLKKELQRAIDNEDYELAAYYRDRIRAFGGSL